MYTDCITDGNGVHIDRVVDTAAIDVVDVDVDNADCCYDDARGNSGMGLQVTAVVLNEK